MKEVIERFALRDVVHRKLLERILRGLYPPGSRVKDTQLSESLQVSRTPVREALLRLVKEGFLENLVGRGFMVRPLTSQEVREIYPIIWNLESLALKESQPLNNDTINQIETVAAEMAEPQPDYIHLIELDQQWHSILLSGCSNQRLLTMIKELKSIAFRYEYAFMQDGKLVETSVEEHRELVTTLLRDGADTAATLLQQHWQFTMNALLEKLTDHP